MSVLLDLRELMKQSVYDTPSLRAAASLIEDQAALLAEWAENTDEAKNWADYEDRIRAVVAR